MSDRRSVDAARALSSPEAKAAALRAQRRAMGLCYKCGEKWSRDHTCSATVQLHVVQELWELFQLEDEATEYHVSSPDAAEELFLAISKAAIHGADAPRTVKFSGSIQHIPVTLLVDSGSSSSFLSTQLAAKLSGLCPLQKPISVQVAGGGKLSCDSFLPQALWFIGDLAFHSDLKVLPLTAYDMIIGMDWLEKFSPMTVHWQQKWLRIPYGDQQVVLQGVQSDYPEQVVVQLCLLTPGGDLHSDVSLLPREVQDLIDQYATIFEKPSQLPPSRACDHEIPLIPGANPVNIRPYRYPPALRDEIEKQLQICFNKG